MCVNYFARTKEFELVRPDYYVICSPEYFIQDEKELYRNQREQTFDAILEKTKWPMIFIVPSLAKSNKVWSEPFKGHPFIDIRYMNTTPIEGFRAFRHLAFNWGLGMPRPHNVLVACLYVAIKVRFHHIYLTGADHSWLNEILVSDDNEVLIGQKHFYDQQTKNQAEEVNRPDPKPMYKGSTKNKRKLHEVLEKFYISFNSYWVLKSYAEAYGVQVINVTDGSFIDAFERKKL